MYYKKLTMKSALGAMHCGMQTIMKIWRNMQDSVVAFMQIGRGTKMRK